MNHIILDIETVPLDMEKYDTLPEEEKFKILNPIDSRIVAIGFKHEGVRTVIIDEDERILLEQFWKKFNDARTKTPGSIIVGFNITNFDLSFLTTRSFARNVQIVPFKLKHVIDIRDKLTAYKSGKTRGTLKDYANFLGIETDGTGAQVSDWWKNKEYDKIHMYLSRDLDMTEAIYTRAKELRILEIEKW